MICLAALADIDQLTELIGHSVRGLSLNDYTPLQIESAIRYIFGIDSQLIKDETYYVFEIGGTIAGCGGWSKRNTLYGGDQFKATQEQLLDPAVDAAKIRAFFVHPDFARRGIGKELMNVCETAAIKAGFHKFEMGATLPGAPFYQVLGYTAVKKILVGMPNGETLPIIRMQKLLN
jgi:GNAT superfamily N-acetyltransferase